uniref:ATP synthase subunit a n=1 Tax=Endecameris sp. ZJUH 20220006 TaxID=2943471 RepID=A0A9E8GDL4_9HYME|nr:ATP synthase F0 subunit 6 [Endecameris sp. ZJUH 20220006]
MMTNLFSIFDPITSYSLSLNWLSSILFLSFFPQMFWLMSYKYMYMWILITNFIKKEINISLINYNSLNILIFISLFIYITLNNFISLFPYIFNSSSHLSFSLFLSLMYWISFMMFGWLKNSFHMFIHLTPQGTPYILMPFMVLIESISNLIRPLTLAIRLSANIIAGHLLMTLMSQSMNSLNLIMIMIMIYLQSILMILELAVSFIQAYVFSILSTLYSSETNYEN